jgi:hypothetical protein
MMDKNLASADQKIIQTLFFKKSLSVQFSAGKGCNIFRMRIKIPIAGIFGTLSLTFQRDSIGRKAYH